MRLIDADACIDDIRNNNQQAWEALAYAPTIDAVKVIRCKDCIYADFKSPYPVCNFLEMNINEDSYCSWGERKEE